MTTLMLLLATHGEATLRTISIRVGLNVVAKAWDVWKRKGIIKRAAQKAASTVETGLRPKQARQKLILWSQTSLFDEALAEWLRAHAHGCSRAVDHFIVAAEFEPQGAEADRRAVAGLLLDAFAAALVREHLSLKGGNPAEAELVLGGLAEQAQDTQAAVHEVRDLVRAQNAPPSLDAAWFRAQVGRAVAAAGDRYTPGAHVRLPAENVFAGAGHEPEVFEVLKAAIENVRQALAQAPGPSDPLSDEVNALVQQAGSLQAGTLVPRPEMRATAARIVALARAEAEPYERVADFRPAQAFGVDARDGGTSPREQPDAQRNADAARALYAVVQAATAVRVAAQRPGARAAATLGLLVTGTAGSGKTHLLCHAAEQLRAAGNPAVLILGQHLGRGEPWSQILQEVGFGGTPTEFLDALDEAGRRAGRRTLLLIDALNESESRETWRTRLAQLLADVAAKSHVALVVSVRSDYLSIVVPESLLADDSPLLFQYPHTGFDGHEQAAADVYFHYYKITPPAAPMLAPEFSNPLFLKLLCQGLARAGYTVVPDDLVGTSAIVNFFVDALDHPAAIPLRIDVDAHSRPARSAAEALAGAMVAAETTKLPRDEAVEVIQAVAPGLAWSRSLYPHLVSEGLLRQDLASLDARRQEVTSFAYERIGDYFVASHFLRDHGSAAALREALSPEGALHRFASERGAWLHAGALGALAVQAPEQIQAELTDLVPDPDHPVIAQAVVSSLLWRRADTITPQTRTLVQTLIATHPNLAPAYLDVRLTLAAQPQHPLNADALHAELSPQWMADRDASWTLALEGHLAKNETALADRLVSWGRGGAPGASAETRRLGAVVLAWMLTSPNRPLRDQATKSLVALVDGHGDTLEALLRMFDGVDAPYVAERLYAVAYGVAMRQRIANPAAVGRLAQVVYDLVFARTPPVHILTRDYARGVIEAARSVGHAPTGDLGRTRPPYPSGSVEPFPTQDECNMLLQSHGGDEPGWSGLRAIHSSLFSMGDFGRYTLGTDHPDQFEWRGRLLGDPTPTLDGELDAFRASLSEPQQEALAAFEEHLTRKPPFAWTTPFTWGAVDDDGDDDEMHFQPDGVLDGPSEEMPTTPPDGPVSLWRAEHERLAAHFVGLVTPDQGQRFSSRLRLHVEQPEPYPYPFDVTGLARWISHRVMALGWTNERFGAADTSDGLRGRDRHDNAKPERMGKKYQWVAYHEALARVADHYEYVSPLETGRPVVPYDGPWDHFYRDIDPSSLLGHTTEVASEGPPFWPPDQEGLWGEGEDAAAWMQRTDDLPDVPSSLVVQGPDGTEYLALHYTRTSPDPDGGDREVWTHVMSALVQTDSLEAVRDWGRDWRGIGRNTVGWIPWPHAPEYPVFLGEWFWSRADAAHRDRPDTITPEASPGFDYESNVPFAFEPTTERYKGPFSHDGSLDERGTSLLLPARALAARLGLHWDGRGAWLGTDGRRVVYDASAYHGLAPNVSSVLLITHEAAESLRRNHGLGLVWSVAGEKQVKQPLGRALDRQNPGGHLQLFGTFVNTERAPTGRLACVFRPHD